MSIPLLNAKVAGMGEDPLLLSVQQLVGGHNVVNVGGSGIEAGYHKERVVDTNMHLHAKVPLVAFLGLMYFLMSLAFFIFGGAGCRNDRRVNNAALPRAASDHFFSRCLLTFLTKPCQDLAVLGIALN